MKHIILYLEDEAFMRSSTTGHLSDDLKKTLKDQEYVVEDFRRIDQAEECFEDNKENIICVITDLNMSDEWLDGYEGDTEGGMISGWVWLQECVYREAPNMPTVIYSAYISFLEEFLEKRGTLNLLHGKDNIALVNKGSEEDDGFRGLIIALRKLGVL